MGDIEIVTIDPLDQAQVDQWLALLQAVQEADVPDLPPIAPTPAIVGLLRQGTSRRKEHWLAREAGQVLGAVDITFTLRDNLRLAEMELCVSPTARRRGIGSALLRHAEQRAVAQGRDTLVTYLVDPLADGPARPIDGQHFARAAGYTPGLDEIRRVADLAAADQRALSELLAQAWQRAEGYELVQWVGVMPPEVVAGAAYLNSRMNLDAPTGEIPYEQEQIDADRLREEESLRRAGGVATLGSVVRHRDSGEVAGYTEIQLDPGEEEHCWQGNTIVDPGHRGKRLGTILKVENHRLLAAYRPRMRYVHTWNAEVNAHMISINEAIGYRPVDRWIAYQKKLA